MSFTHEQTAALSAPLDKARVATREQGGKTLSYIEAWHCIAEANRIFGFGHWNRETVELRQLGEPRVTQDKYGKDQMRVGYSARVRITVRAGDSVIVREGCGFGSGIDRDTDQAHESALKEAESDAMKRALMTFGNPFGLALYDKTQANVAEVVSAVVQTATTSLSMCLDEAALKEWSASNGEMIAGLPEAEKQGIRKAYAARQTAIKTANNPFSKAA